MIDITSLSYRTSATVTIIIDIMGITIITDFTAEMNSSDIFYSFQRQFSLFLLSSFSHLPYFSDASNLAPPPLAN
jgi:hypothetical protein